MLAADVVVYGDGGGKSPSWPRPIVGRDRVGRLFGARRADAACWAATVAAARGERTAGCGRPRPDGRVINVFSLDIADGVVQTIRSVINPDKLRHLGPLADVRGLLSELRGQSRDRGSAGTSPDRDPGPTRAPEPGLVIEALALSNTTSDERRRRFLIGPDAYRAAEARATETGKSLIGFYHSHPNHPAIPSAFDLEHAWPNLRYVIVSVMGGRPEAVRTWRLRTDRSGFDEEELVRPAEEHQPS